MPITEDVGHIIGTMGLNNFSGSNLGTNATFMHYENNLPKLLDLLIICMFGVFHHDFSL